MYADEKLATAALAFYKLGDAERSREVWLEAAVHKTVDISASHSIGLKSDGTVVMASANCDLQGLGKIMQALGCQTAMNLDGGASAALYVGGSARVTEGRALSHLIIFTAK